jgi:transitional endoplasmic reticulum ATPase
MDEDAQPEITRKHFEEAFNLARRSVNAAELNKYDHFRRSFDPVYRAEQGGGSADVINWPEDDTQFAPAAADDDEDDLYS